MPGKGLGIFTHLLMVFYIFAVSILGSETPIPDEKTTTVNSFGARFGVNLMNYPFHVIISIKNGDNAQSSNTSICQGSIISLTKIVTTAFCVKDVEPSSIVALTKNDEFWQQNISSDMTVFNIYTEKNAVKNVAIHPKYNHRIRIYDIAVLTLSTNITYAFGRKSIELPRRNIYDKMMPQIITLRTNNYTNIVPHVSTMHLIYPRKKIPAPKPKYTQWPFFFAKTFGNSLVCDYGIGTALAENNTLYGILSRIKNACVTRCKNAAVFTNVYNHRDFIKGEMEKL